MRWRWLLRRFRYVRELEMSVCYLMAKAAAARDVNPAAQTIAEAIDGEASGRQRVELEMLVWDEGGPRRRFFEVWIQEVEHECNHRRYVESQ